MTSRKWVHLPEVTRLKTLNTVVRGWCEYYKHISLQADLEQISRYTWHRYHGWIRKKHKNIKGVVKATIFVIKRIWWATVVDGVPP
jgi:hypothetical protein